MFKFQALFEMRHIADLSMFKAPAFIDVPRPWVITVCNFTPDGTFHGTGLSRGEYTLYRT